MSLEVWGDDNAEDLVELAEKYSYQLCSDDKWREDMSEPGLSDEQMWDYVNAKREDDIESLYE